ncbi:hypothetical protein Q671_16125 [Halomonas sp. PBN3]|nr:hypothetical protein Q671_16125 [Halomonas sp. PBN3]
MVESQRTDLSLTLSQRLQVCTILGDHDLPDRAKTTVVPYYLDHALPTLPGRHGQWDLRRMPA